MKNKKKMKKGKVQLKRGKANKGTAKAKNIQEQVRDLILETISKRSLTMKQMSQVTSAILSGATASIKNLLPASRKSILRQVLNGIDDAWAATAKASASSVQHARRYGFRIAQRDLDSLKKRLGALDRELISTLNDHARRLSSDLGGEFKYLTKQIEKAGTQVRPAAEAARKVISENGGTLTREVVSVGTKAGRQAIQSALFATSELLEGAGKALGRSSH